MRRRAARPGSCLDPQLVTKLLDALLEHHPLVFVHEFVPVAGFAQDGAALGLVTDGATEYPGVGREVSVPSWSGPSEVAPSRGALFLVA